MTVGFKVEPVRVGEITNFDKLTLTVETDGSITPKQAIEDSVKILMNHYKLLEEINEGAAAEAAPAAPPEQSVLLEDTGVTDEAAPAAPAGDTEEKPKKRGRKKASEE